MLIKYVILIIIIYKLEINELKIISPSKLSSVNLNSEILQLTIYFKIDFKIDKNIKDLKLNFHFPFQVTNNFEFYWKKIDNTCIKPSNLVKSNSVFNRIDGTYHLHYLNLIDFNYNGQESLFYIDIIITNSSDLNLGVGYSNPIKCYIISEFTNNSLYFSYNDNIYLIYGDNTLPNNDVEIDFSPSYEDKNINYITRNFFAQMDLLVKVSIYRILIKLDNYTFSDDTESNCSTVNNDSLGLFFIENSKIQCVFENNNRKGLFIIFESPLPINKFVRIKFRVKNPNIPSTTNIKFYAYEKYAPILILKKTLTNAFKCSETFFSKTYPKLFIGPFLDTSQSSFPNISLYSAMENTNAIIFNSILIQFKIEIDIPIINNGYIIKINIKGNSQTVIPENFIYHNLDILNDKAKAKFEIQTNGDIWIRYISSFASSKIYYIGFKIAFNGNETLVFDGNSNVFGSLKVEDIDTNSLIVRLKNPYNINTRFKSLITQTIPSVVNMPTVVHSLSGNASNSDFVNINSTINNFGLIKGENLQFFIKGSFLKFTSLNLIPLESYIEIITDKSIYIQNEGVYTTTSNICLIKDNTGTDQNNYSDCSYYKINKGLLGQEYSRFRIRSLNSNFWGSNTQDYIWGFKNTVVSKYSSLYFEDLDSAILDCYINIYQETLTYNINDTFNLGPELKILQNLIVKQNNLFDNTKIEFINYYGSTTDNLFEVPILIRISGLLDNINTFKTRRLSLFFHDIEPLVENFSLPYQIGCSSSIKNSISCFYYKGINSRTCGSNTCVNRFSFSRIDIIIPSENISVSDRVKLQILIPVTVLQNKSLASYKFALAPGISHNGDFSKYTQLIGFKYLPDISRPNVYPNNKTSVNLTSTVINSNAAYKPGGLLFNNIPRIGSIENNNLSINCQSTDDQCVITSNVLNNIYFSITLCMPYNFMNDINFNVSNNLSDLEKQCVKNINYKYDTNNSKYCFWCPFFGSGNAGLSLLVLNINVQSTNGLYWQSGTFASVSGRSNNYGLFKLTDYTLITNKSYNNNFIINLQNDPLPIYYQSSTNTNYKSLIFKFNIRLSNSLPSNKYLVFNSVDSFKFEFSFNPNTHCLIINLTNNKEISCSTTLLNANNFYLTANEILNKGDYLINIMGINGNIPNPPTSLPIEYNLNIYTSISSSISNISNNNFILDKLNTDFKIILQEYLPLDINKILISNLNISNLDTKAISDISFNLELFANKFFYPSDMIIINLNGLAYNTINSSPVRCIITDFNSNILTEINECNTLDLSNITITTTKITNYNKFKISLIGVKLNSNSNTISAKMVYRLNTSITILPTGSINIPSLLTINNLTDLTLTKTLSFSGLKPIYEFSIKLTNIDLVSKNKIHVRFPTEYNSYFDKYQFICKLKYKDIVKLLYCYVPKEYTIEIISLINIPRNESFIISISGPRQPITNGELFYISIMQSSQENISLESLRTSYASNSKLGNKTWININNLKYSHYYIRSPLNLNFDFVVNASVLKGSYLEIVLDYLKWENERGIKIECSWKSLTNIDFLEKCIYDENKIKLYIKDDLVTNEKYKVFVKNIPNLDYEYCKILLPEFYLYKSNKEFIAFLSSFLLNTDHLSFNRNKNKIYIEFENVNINSHFELYRDVKNIIKVYEYNHDKFPDDLDLNINKNDNNSSFFTFINSQKKNSTIGYYNFDFSIYGNENTPNTIIPLSFNLNSKYFSENIVLPPFLKVRWLNKKNNFIIDNEIKLWKNKSSLEWNLSIKFEVIKLVKTTLRILNCTFLKIEPNIIYFYSKKKDSVFKISFINNISTLVNNCQWEITSNNPFFNNKIVNLKIDNYDEKNAVTLKIGNITNFSLFLNISSKSPIKLFYFFTYYKLYYKRFDYQIFRYIKERKKVNYEIFGSKTFNKLTDINFNLIDNKLLSDINYKGIIYWYDIKGEKGFFELDFSTKNDNSNDGYINITFDNKLTPNQKRKLVCVFGQILKYPLINLQTEKGYKCEIKLENNVNNYSDLNPLENLIINNSTNINSISTNSTNISNSITNNTTISDSNRILQLKIIEIIDGKEINNNIKKKQKEIIKLYLLKNRDYIFDHNAYIKIQKYVIKKEFKIELKKRLFDLPNIVKIDPLISLQFWDQKIYTGYKIFKKNNKNLVVTELKTKIPGYLYVGALDFIDNLDKRLNIKHILNGTDNYGHPLNYYRKWNITEKNQVFYLLIDNIQVPNLPEKKNFSIFLLATDYQNNILSRTSSLINQNFWLFDKKIIQNNITSSNIKILKILIIFLILLY